MPKKNPADGLEAEMIRLLDIAWDPDSFVILKQNCLNQLQRGEELDSPSRDRILRVWLNADKILAHLISGGNRWSWRGGPNAFQG